jgi:uncharacterized membrane protein
MKWYWWAIISILAINGFVIILIALALVADRIRKSREAGNEKQENSDILKGT